MEIMLSSKEVTRVNWANVSKTPSKYLISTHQAVAVSLGRPVGMVLKDIVLKEDSRATS